MLKRFSCNIAFQVLDRQTLKLQERYESNDIQRSDHEVTHGQATTVQALNYDNS